MGNIFILLTLTATFHSVSISKPEIKDRKINLALETVLEFDNKDNRADLTFLDNVQNFIGKVKTVIDKSSIQRREFSGPNIEKFTDFVHNALDILYNFHDDDLEEFFSIVSDEVRKYHYRGCKFYELTENYDLRKFIASGLDAFKNIPAKSIRSRILKISKKIEREDYNDNERELVDFINSLYRQNSVEKFKKILVDIDDYRLMARDNTDLVKIVKEGIRSIIFDHYTELNHNARVALKSKIDEYWRYLMDLSKTLLSQLNAKEMKLRSYNVNQNIKVDDVTIKDHGNVHTTEHSSEGKTYHKITTKRSNSDIYIDVNKVLQVKYRKPPYEYTTKCKSKVKRITFMTLYPKFVSDHPSPKFRVETIRPPTTRTKSKLTIWKNLDRDIQPSRFNDTDTTLSLRLQKQTTTKRRKEKRTTRQMYVEQDLDLKYDLHAYDKISNLSQTTFLTLYPKFATDITTKLMRKPLLRIPDENTMQTLWYEENQDTYKDIIQGSGEQRHTQQKMHNKYLELVTKKPYVFRKVTPKKKFKYEVNLGMHNNRRTKQNRPAILLDNPGIKHPHLNQRFEIDLESPDVYRKKQTEAAIVFDIPKVKESDHRYKEKFNSPYIRRTKQTIPEIDISRDEYPNSNSKIESRQFPKDFEDQQYLNLGKGLIDDKTYNTKKRDMSDEGFWVTEPIEREHRRSFRKSLTKIFKDSVVLDKRILTRLQDLEKELKVVKTQIKNDTETIKVLNNKLLRQGNNHNEYKRAKNISNKKYNEKHKTKAMKEVVIDLAAQINLDNEQLQKENNFVNRDESLNDAFQLKSYIRNLSRNDPNKNKKFKQNKYYFGENTSKRNNGENIEQSQYEKDNEIHKDTIRKDFKKTKVLKSYIDKSQHAESKYNNKYKEKESNFDRTIFHELDNIDNTDQIKRGDVKYKGSTKTSDKHMYELESYADNKEDTYSNKLDERKYDFNRNIFSNDKNHDRSFEENYKKNRYDSENKNYINASVYNQFIRDNEVYKDTTKKDNKYTTEIKIDASKVNRYSKKTGTTKYYSNKNDFIRGKNHDISYEENDKINKYDNENKNDVNTSINNQFIRNNEVFRDTTKKRYIHTSELQSYARNSKKTSERKYDFNRNNILKDTNYNQSAEKKNELHKYNSENINYLKENTDKLFNRDNERFRDMTTIDTRMFELKNYAVNKISSYTNKKDERKYDFERNNFSKEQYHDIIYKETNDGNKYTNKNYYAENENRKEQEKKYYGNEKRYSMYDSDSGKRLKTRERLYDSDITINNYKTDIVNNKVRETHERINKSHDENDKDRNIFMKNVKYEFHSKETSSKNLYESDRNLTRQTMHAHDGNLIKPMDKMHGFNSIKDRWNSFDSNRKQKHLSKLETHEPYKNVKEYAYTKDTTKNIKKQFDQRKDLIKDTKYTNIKESRNYYSDSDGRNILNRIENVRERNKNIHNVDEDSLKRDKIYDPAKKIHDADQSLPIKQAFHKFHNTSQQSDSREDRHLIYRSYSNESIDYHRDIHSKTTEAKLLGNHTADAINKLIKLNDFNFSTEKSFNVKLSTNKISTKELQLQDKKVNIEYKYDIVQLSKNVKDSYNSKKDISYENKSKLYDSTEIKEKDIKYKDNENKLNYVPVNKYGLSHTKKDAIFKTNLNKEIAKKYIPQNDSTSNNNKKYYETQMQGDYVDDSRIKYYHNDMPNKFFDSDLLLKDDNQHVYDTFKVRYTNETEFSKTGPLSSNKVDKIITTHALDEITTEKSEANKNNTKFEKDQKSLSTVTSIVTNSSLNLIVVNAATATSFKIPTAVRRKFTEETRASMMTVSTDSSLPTSVSNLVPALDEDILSEVDPMATMNVGLDGYDEMRKLGSLPSLAMMRELEKNNTHNKTIISPTEGFDTIMEKTLHLYEERKNKTNQLEGEAYYHFVNDYDNNNNVSVLVPEPKFITSPGFDLLL